MAFPGDRFSHKVGFLMHTLLVLMVPAAYVTVLKYFLLAALFILYGYVLIIGIFVSTITNLIDQITAFLF